MQIKKFPPWLKKRFIQDKKIDNIRLLLQDSNLHTVCQSARCPNLRECFRKGRVTFLILGNRCSRSCRFCGVEKGKPMLRDKDEPRKIAQLVKKMKLDHVIITSVTRDDLLDGGAEQFSSCIDEIRKTSPSSKVEVLTPDFKGEHKNLEKVIRAQPDIFAHNIETVPRLYNKLRPEADYRRSLALLKEASKISPLSLLVKSGIMVGLGENEEEIYQVISDLKESGCTILTIGQYLQPSKAQIGASEFIHPLVFERYKEKAFKLGFAQVASGPFVRSSYVS